tara:strand:+ start:2953 stop:3975 length:1023 start_codon:yes stop_codon:yes gene_type:complete
MNLYINNLKDNEVITSFNFARNSDYVFSEIITKDKFDILHNKNKLYNISESENQILYVNSEIKIKENDVIFCNTYFVKELFSKLKNVSNLKNLKLITNQTDHSITKELFKLKPSCISEWYSINIDFNSPDLIPIPLGLSNQNEKNLNKKHFSELKENKNKIYKIYINFQKNTNYFKRNKQIKKFKNKSFVHIDEPNLQLSEYAEKLNSYKFILCPVGNGIDTHRVWESLYAGSVPIVQKHISMSTLENLDAIQIDDFKGIDLNLIRNYTPNTENDQKLNIEYWINKITESKLKSDEILNIKLTKEDLDKFNKNYFRKLGKESNLKKIKTFQRKLYSKLGF